MAMKAVATPLRWHTTRVDGRGAGFLAAGAGVPVVFVHGWGIGPRSYRQALERMAGLGCRVLAPALPDLAGTEGLPRGWRELEDYAGWVDAFMTSVGLAEPAVTVGHGLGGAVAARLAHDAADRVAHLVLLNSIGSPRWEERSAGSRPAGTRPLWHWARSFSRDILLDRAGRPTVQAMAGDVLANVLRNPVGLARTAGMVRRVDVVAELAEVRRSGVPATVVTSAGDLVVPVVAFEDICRALGVTGRVVPGRHSWLLSAPDDLAGVMVPVLATANAERAARQALRPRVITPITGRRLAVGD